MRLIAGALLLLAVAACGRPAPERDTVGTGGGTPGAGYNGGAGGTSGATATGPIR